MVGYRNTTNQTALCPAILIKCGNGFFFSAFFLCLCLVFETFYGFAALSYSNDKFNTHLREVQSRDRKFGLSELPC